MRQYPSIPKALSEFLNSDCISFRKYDGSQIRVGWSNKKGWHKFATRGQLFDQTDKNFGSAVEIFHRTHGEPLEKAIVDNFRKVTEAVAFLEFIGPHSFAGLHDPGILNVENNDPKELVLFDVNVHQKGILSPQDFVKFFSHTRSAEVLYKGPLTEDFIKDVRESKYPVDEGVVCKGLKKPGNPHSLWLCKIKTWAYLKKIQAYFGTSFGNYWE